MINKYDHGIGITPILLRRAAYYMRLGLGVYFPEHPHFDKVTVTSLYDLTPHPFEEGHWATGVRVSFFKENRNTRWVEFTCQVSGTGGDSILREIK